MGEIKPLSNGTFGDASWLITSRWNGVSVGNYYEANLATHVGDDSNAVLQNRESLASQISKNVVYPVACHGTEFAQVVDKSLEDISEVDALITSEKNIALAILSADCASILIYAEEIQQIAAIHAGWRGMNNAILPKVLSHLINNGAKSFKAVIGPSICANCYRVSRERYLEVQSMVPSAAKITSEGKYCIDIQAGLISQFLQYEITPELVNICTFENPDVYSYRRDGITGRFASAIWFN